MDSYLMISSYSDNTNARIGVKKITGKAIYVETRNGTFEWFPLSQVRFFIVEGGIAMVMPVWMARQKYGNARHTTTCSVDLAVSQGRATQIYPINEDGTVNTDAVIML